MKRLNGNRFTLPLCSDMMNTNMIGASRYCPPHSRESSFSSTNSSGINRSTATTIFNRQSKRGISPRTRAISAKSSLQIKFISELPQKLLTLLKRWDNGNRLVRKNILENFVTDYSNQTSATIEADFANGGSLLLSRFSSWLKLNRQTGYILGLQFQALSAFVTASSGASYLSELVESGVIMIALDIFGDSDIVEMSNKDIYQALSFLRLVASTGRMYKEILCNADAIAKIVDCLLEQTHARTCEICRTLLIELGTGNPKYSHSVLRGLLRLLPCKNPFARRIGAQVTRTLISPHSPHFYTGFHSAQDRATHEVTMMSFVPVTISMIKSVDIQVQYEGTELLKILAQQPDACPTILAGILPLLKTVRIQSAKDDMRSVTLNNGAVESDVSKEDEVNSHNLSSYDCKESSEDERVHKNFHTDNWNRQADRYLRKANTCLSWQASAARVLTYLCQDIDRMSSYIVEAGGIPFILGVLLNSSNEAGQKAALDLLSVIVNHVPTAAALMNEVAGIDIWKMMAPDGYSGVLQMPVTDDSEIGNAIRGVGEKLSAVNIVLDDSDSFISSDVEHLFLSSNFGEDRNCDDDDVTISTDIHGSASEEEADGGDYKELMEKIMHDSNKV